MIPWTVEQYHGAGDAGRFAGRHVELLEGRIIGREPSGPPEAVAITLAGTALRTVFGRGYVVRIQQPITLSGISEPEPDALVVAGKARDFVKDHPTSALLIVEVAHTSLSYDRNEKASSHVRAGIEDYWIVNTVGGQVEVYREPRPDPAAPYGYSYATVTTFLGSQMVSPLALPGRSVLAGDLLP